MRKKWLAALALGACAALLAVPFTGAKYVRTASVPYTLTVLPNTYFFGYTGTGQTLTVPKTGYYALRLWGADGGDGTLKPINNGFMNAGPGGSGGHVTAVFSLAQNDVLEIQVGGAGENGDSIAGGKDPSGQDLPDTPLPGNGGYNGGAQGDGGLVEYVYAPAGGGGGGATDVRLNGSGLGDRIAVAGGGGGGGGSSFVTMTQGGGDGGDGYVNPHTIDGVNGHFLGGSEGLPGNNSSTGGSAPQAGSPGNGGGGAGPGAGGGGGGYYGGGGGAGNGSGGGGSSFIDAGWGWQANATLASTLPGPGDDPAGAYVEGWGYAIISYLGTQTPDTSPEPSSATPNALGGMGGGVTAYGLAIAGDSLLEEEWPGEDYEEQEALYEDAYPDEPESPEEITAGEYAEGEPPAEETIDPDPPEEDAWPADGEGHGETWGTLDTDAEPEPSTEEPDGQ